MLSRLVRFAATPAQRCLLLSISVTALQVECADVLRAAQKPSSATSSLEQPKRVRTASAPALVSKHSQILFEQPLFVEQYRSQIAVLTLLVLQTLLIAALLANRARRVKAERENAILARLAQQEHRRLDEIVSNVPGIVWEARGELWRSEEGPFVSEHVEKMLGYSVSEWLSTPDFWLSIVAQEDREEIAHGVEEVFASGKDGVLQFRWQAMDGRMLWAESHLTPILDEASRIVGVRGVTLDITERKRAEQALTESEANYHSIFNAVNDAIFVHDTETGAVVDVNQVMCDMYKVTVDEARALGPDVLSSNEPPYTRMNALAWIRKAVEGEPQIFEWHARDKTGRLFWVEVSLRRAVIARKERVLAVVRDITYRRQSEEALRESEERFRAMADTAPVMIWLADTETKCTYFNHQWLAFTGRTIEQELGAGWAEGVHPDDLKHCLDIYNTSFYLRQKFIVDYRLRRADGEFRWVYVSGIPRFSSSRKFLGYIGSCIDITERKAAEEALANLSGQLIAAREDECARIARELHDDLNQSIALVSVELEQLSRNPPDTDDELLWRLQGVMKQTAEISREIHRMSYDLHPSKLVLLGLVAALNGLCDELQQSHRVEIEFTNEDVPADLAQDVALCLYRIVQECLNNVIKHSNARNASVELRGAGSEIRLRVSDSGIGFDMGSPMTRKGLGLLSMRERLRLVRGTISVDSRPSQGTRIEARVPLGRIARAHEGHLLDDQTRAAGVD